MVPPRYGHQRRAGGAGRELTVISYWLLSQGSEKPLLPGRSVHEDLFRGERDETDDGKERGGWGACPADRLLVIKLLVVGSGHRDWFFQLGGNPDN